MTPRRRALMLHICDGNSFVPPHLFTLDRFTRCDEILEWLARNRITGAKFLDWLRGDYGNSVLAAGADVLKRIDRNLERSPIIGGRDFDLSARRSSDRVLGR